MKSLFTALILALLQVTWLTLWAHAIPSVTSFVDVDSPQCDFTSGWKVADIANAYGNRVAFSQELGGQLWISLPANVTTLTYIGMKNSTPAVYAACMDCTSAEEVPKKGKQFLISYNTTTSTAGLNVTVPIFAFDNLDPQVEHVLAVADLSDPFGKTGRISFAGLLVSTNTIASPPGDPEINPIPGDASPTPVSPPASSSSQSTTVTYWPNNNWVGPSSVSSSRLPTTTPILPFPGAGIDPSSTTTQHVGLSTAVVAVIAVLSALGVIALAGLLIFFWRRRQRGAAARGTALLSDRDSATSSMRITPYFLADSVSTGPRLSTGSGSASVRPGSPSTPNFFSSNPFGYGAGPAMSTVGQHGSTYNPFDDSQAIVQVPRSPPPSPWLTRTPRDTTTGL